MEDKKLRIDQWDRVILDSIFTIHPFSISEIDTTFLVFNKSFDDLIRHLEYADMLAISPTEPIPLTEEWLIKFGLKHTESTWYYLEFGTTHLTINPISKKTVLGSRKCVHEAWNIHLNHCEYVHQLQNLFFTLTGKELT